MYSFPFYKQCTQGTSTSASQICSFAFRGTVSLTSSFTRTGHDNLYMNGNISVIMESKSFDEPKEIKKPVKKCTCTSVGRDIRCPIDGDADNI